MTTTLNSLGQVNSTSYQDVPGLYAGLPRLSGEDTITYKNRLEINSVNLKTHNYEGTLENVNTHLGLNLFQAIEIDTTYVDAFLTYSFGAIHLTSTAETLSIPTLIISPDKVWLWRKLSEIVADINLSIGFTATLLNTDGPALQLAKQQNSGWIVNESVKGALYNLEFGNYIDNTASFNTSVSDFTITNNTLTLSQEYPDLAISYRYKKWPYKMVGSTAAVISLVDPSVQDYMIVNNDLVYQIKEVVQSLMQIDGSYWAM